MHLQQPQHLQDMPGLRVDSVDTTEAHHEEHLLLGLNIEGARLPRGTLHRHELLLLLPVLLHVLLRTLEGLSLLRGTGSRSSGRLGPVLLIPFLLTLALLEHRLRDSGLGSFGRHLDGKACG